MQQPLHLLGAAAAAHFLSPDQVRLVTEALQKAKSPLEVVVELESFEDLYLKFAERVSTTLRMNISQRALHGSFLDLLSSSDLNDLESKIQKQCLDFARDFLKCTCMDSPYCGCPQKCISLRILWSRAEGKSPSDIINEFSDKYGMYAYQGDLINYLDQAVRYLEAIESLSKVLGRTETMREAQEMRKRIEGD